MSLPPESVVRLAVHTEDEVVELSSSVAARVFERFPLIAREAQRWQAKLGKPGTLVLIDPGVIREIEAFLSEGGGA